MRATCNSCQHLMKTNSQSHEGHRICKLTGNALDIGYWCDKYIKKQKNKKKDKKNDTA